MIKWRGSAKTCLLEDLNERTGKILRMAWGISFLKPEFVARKQNANDSRGAVFACSKVAKRRNRYGRIQVPSGIPGRRGACSGPQCEGYFGDGNRTAWEQWYREDPNAFYQQVGPCSLH